MSSLERFASNGEVRAEPVRMRVGVEWAYVAKYNGDRGSRPEATGNPFEDRLAALQADLADPACVEIIVFGDGFPTQTWRKTWD